MQSYTDGSGAVFHWKKSAELGSIPRTERGNEHILMMVDQFTKWVECIPLPSQSAEETARAAVNQFFSRFGCPFQVFTDQGRNFESSLFREMCELLHIHKSRTTPYYYLSERISRAVQSYTDGSGAVFHWKKISGAGINTYRSWQGH